VLGWSLPPRSSQSLTERQLPDSPIKATKSD
jgi:hypothetical protein